MAHSVHVGLLCRCSGCNTEIRKGRPMKWWYKAGFMAEDLEDEVSQTLKRKVSKLQIVIFLQGGPKK